MSRQPPVQQPPPVQKLLVQYGKTGPGRFASHRDFARVFERALRRAGLPMAYSSGFSPHPRVSYVNPAATGAASQAEYLVIGLAQAQEPATVLAELAAVMPAGFPLFEVSPLTGDVRFEASRWQLAWPGAEPAELASAIARFGRASAIEVSRQTKPESTDAARRERYPGGALAAPATRRQTGGLGSVAGAASVPPGGSAAAHDRWIRAKDGWRRFEVKSAVSAMDLVGPTDRADPLGPTLMVVIQHGQPLVRPDDVAAALRAVAPRLPSAAPLATRLAQL